MDIDDLLSDALQEAYASAPVDEVILHTLEIRHPAFPGGALRVVRDYGMPYTISGESVSGHFLKLEDSAPLQAGQSVFFVGCMFDVKLPEQEEGRVGSLEIEVDNVGGMISKYMDAAVSTRDKVQITYREYLASDPDSVEFILGGLVATEISSSLSRVKCTATFWDLNNRSFPGKVYRPEEFLGLLR